MTWRQSNVTLTNQDVCLSVTSLNDNVARSIDLHRWIASWSKMVHLREVSGKCKYNTYDIIYLHVLLPFPTLMSFVRRAVFARRGSNIHTSHVQVWWSDCSGENIRCVYCNTPEPLYPTPDCKLFFQYLPKKKGKIQNQTKTSDRTSKVHTW